MRIKIKKFIKKLPEDTTYITKNFETKGTMVKITYISVLLALSLTITGKSFDTQFV